MQQIKLGFTGAPMDRASQSRGNADWVRQKLNDESSRFIAFVNGQPVMDAGKVVRFTRKQIDTRQAILLNLDAKSNAVFAVRSNMAAETVDLRSLAMAGEQKMQELGMLAQAKSLLAWHDEHRFCSKCGSITQMVDAGYRRHCSTCDTSHFPRVDPVVIMLVRHGDDLLLGRGIDFSENVYSTLAGFVEPGETLEAAAARETFEETGIRLGQIDYVCSQPWPFPSSMMIGMNCQAISRDIVLDETELADARWFHMDDVRLMLEGKHHENIILPPPMAIAHELIRQVVESYSV